ncbi:OsmC-like protein [Pseudoscourfieldia marina]
MAASRALSSVFLRGKSRLHTYALTAVGTSTSTSTSFQRAPPSTTSSHSSFVVHTDTLASDGGTDTAPQPVELLLAALVGCEQATAHFVSRHMRVDKKRVKIDTIKFDYHAVRDERGAASLPLHKEPPAPARLLAVSGTASVRLDEPTDGDDAERAVAELGKLVHARCPVAQTLLSAGVSLDVHWCIAK